MCEANAYIERNGKQELFMESVDVVEPAEDGGFLLVNIFGHRKRLHGRLKKMNLVDHKILFEPQQA
jgi:predicted RNA-binding protein